jgi:uncharacterized heparinase superfamily protein
MRLLHTVRHLRLEQIAHQFYYRLAGSWVDRRALSAIESPVLRSWLKPWSAPLVMARSHISQGRFQFLGEQGKVESAADWNSPDRAKLWLYNLHYLDDLNAVGADDRKDLQNWLVQNWISDNPPLAGNGWEPYPLSLRLVNLVKWFARQHEVPEKWLDSMARQAHALSVREERHILANHLFANGKALVFVGSYLSGKNGDAWLRNGLRILDREVAEQFRSDGGHFELSSMYHATLLWDLCDLVNLSDRCGLPELKRRRSKWVAAIEQGHGWLSAMSHPDGEISFFNDAAIGVAPSPAALSAYADRLGLQPSRPTPVDETTSIPCWHFSDTGYVVVEPGSNSKLILDVAEVGPAYQPGHAHADTLSCELALFGQRVLVNSGISQYGQDAERHRQRGTAAHNTVEIDGENSSEIWSGFRVARRAHPGVPQITSLEEGYRISCTHDGYRWLPGKPVHHRCWQINARRLLIEDHIEGEFESAVARFHLHPMIRYRSNCLTLPDGQLVECHITGGEVRAVDSTWHPEFGTSMKSRCIEVAFSGDKVSFELVW